MAGGVGSRFWPMSTTEHPKQFIDVLGTGRTMIQMAFDRFDGQVGLKIARLALAPGLTLADAHLALGFAPGRVTATL